MERLEQSRVRAEVSRSQQEPDPIEETEAGVPLRGRHPGPRDRYLQAEATRRTTRIR